LNAARFYIDVFDIDGMRLDAANVLDKIFMTELRRVTSEIKNDFLLMGEGVHGKYVNVNFYVHCKREISGVLFDLLRGKQINPHHFQMEPHSVLILKENLN